MLQLEWSGRVLPDEAARELPRRVRWAEGCDAQPMPDCLAAHASEQEGALLACWQPKLQTPPEHNKEQWPS